jgi:hypothetical protein
MFIYSINIWQQQNYTFIYRLNAISTINLFILYIKKKYKVYSSLSNDEKNCNKIKRGKKQHKNLFKLYQLIDLYGINNLIYGELNVLYPESETILYVNYTRQDFILMKNNTHKNTINK